MADLDLSGPRLKASGFGGLGSGPAASPRGEEGDVGGCFYYYTLPELAPWFCFEGHFDTYELEDTGRRPAMIWDDAEGAEAKVEAGEVLYPCMAAVCMGWSWAFFFANEAATHRVERTLDGGADQIMREMQPAPVLKPGKCVAGACVDNAQVIGGCAGDAGKQMHEIEKSFCEDNKPFDVGPRDGFEMQSLGLRWLGHAVNLNQLCPEAMSALSVPRRAWPSVKSEIRCAMNLFFLMEADLGATFSNEVYCGDSSTRGYALHVTKAEPGELREAWRWRERWRYRDIPVQEGHMTDGLGHVRGDAPGLAAEPRTAFGQVDLGAGAPRLADGWTGRQRCQLVAADRWRWQEEYINLKEARVALMGPRRHCRTAGRLGAELLTLSDSQVTVGAYEKGRSSAGLQTLCRRAAAYRLGGQIAWRLRYIETDRNPSDQDSRRWGTKRAAGSDRAALLLSRVGLPFADPVDMKDVWEFDLSRRSTQDFILDLEKLGVEFALFTATLCHILSRRVCYWSVENPRTSRLWSFEPVARPRGLPAAIEVNFDMSMFGAPYRKPTRILTNAGAPRALGERPRVSHKHAVMLHGRLTPQAAAYPSSLGACWAGILAAGLPRGALARAVDFDPQELRHGLLWAAGRQPTPSEAAMRGEGNELAGDACRAADDFFGADPAIQFGQPSAARHGGALRVQRRDTLVIATMANDTLKRCAAAVRELELHAKAKKLDLQPLSCLNDSLLPYFVDPFDDGFDAWEGRNTFYCYRRPRFPATDTIVDNIALDLVDHIMPLLGAAVVLEMDANPLPSGTVELRPSQILPPAPAAKPGVHFGAVIAPSNWHETTKTGGQDDSTLNRNAAHPWLARVTNLLFKPKAPYPQRLFTFTLVTLPEFERAVKRSMDRLGYAPLKVCPRVFRRSGASNNKARGRRT
ncbi:unnamed protein product [Prorocentrum cordatum]|uniref:Uncharacterized protein n=1 Tax=Prorocentrum cordatum TaxID=2364126 RepID=A0ABN9UCE1_9DINO|nr:unnamed protein product [Polarella glacialis]